MAGLPALATAVSATQSPTEFPTARTVRPRMAGNQEREHRQKHRESNTCANDVVEAQAMYDVECG